VQPYDEAADPDVGWNAVRRYIREQTLSVSIENDKTTHARYEKRGRNSLERNLSFVASVLVAGM
jgi:hypothetical protein